VRDRRRPSSEAIDAGGYDLVILDGEAAPPAASVSAVELKNEIFNCPPVLVLTGRPQDGWLAGVGSLADAVRVTPAGPDRQVAEAVASGANPRRPPPPERGGR
jgi:hypothetical protein